MTTWLITFSHTRHSVRLRDSRMPCTLLTEAFALLRQPTGDHQVCTIGAQGALQLRFNGE